MNDIIEVFLDLQGKPTLVGRCRYLTKPRSQTSIFEYADEWLAHEQAFAIDPENLPLQETHILKQSTKSALPGALRDTAPDRWGQQLIKRAFRKLDKERTLSEMDYLLAMTDTTRIGALRYKRPDEQAFDHDVGSYRIPPLIKLPALVHAADAIQSNTETAQDIRLLLNEGSPLGGARPKSAILDKDGSLAIAKFPKTDDSRSIPHGEVLLMQLAKAVGLDVAAARIENVAGRPVSIITRFDRQVSDTGMQRIPFLSAMSLLGLDDGDSACYTDIADVIRKYSSEPVKDLKELFGRVVFNVLTSNLDDHLRNHAFVYAGQGKWKLSPAYDLNPVPVFEKSRILSTWISEEGPDADLDIARQAAKYFKLNSDEAQTLIEQQQSVIKNWRAVAKRIGMSAADIKTYASAFKLEN